MDEGRCPMQGHSLGCHRVSRDLEFTSFAKGCNVPCNVLLNDVKCKVEKWKSMTFLVMSVMSFWGGHVVDVGMIQGNPLGLQRSETMDTGTLQAIHM